MTGPFETELEAIEATGQRDWVPHDRKDRNEFALLRACELAGVDVGAYDRRILAWFAGFEPQACAVVAGLILRAGAAP